MYGFRITFLLLITLYQVEVCSQDQVDNIKKYYNDINSYQVALKFEARYDTKLDSIVGLFKSSGYNANDFEYFDFFSTEPM